LLLSAPSVGGGRLATLAGRDNVLRRSRSAGHYSERCFSVAADRSWKTPQALPIRRRSGSHLATSQE
jgi:hypothetical protein